MLHYEAWGSDKTYPHMSVAWSWAFDTPFKWTKQVASHFGGTRQGMVISWPGHIKDAGGIRTQFHHIIDIVPTILEATGIQAPATVNGIAQKPIEGVSMAYTFDKANANAPSKREHAVFRDVRQSRHLSRRLVCLHDAARAAVAHGNGQAARRQRIQVGALQHRRGLLAKQRPRRQESRQAEGAAGVVPDGGGEIPGLAAGQLDPAAAHLRRGRARPPGRTVFTYTGENAGIPVGNAPSILNKDYTITAEVTIPKGGAEGMIATLGGRFGGYGLYLLKGKPVFVYNMLDLKRYRWEGGVGGADWLGDSLKPGKHTIVFDFKYDGPGSGKGGTGVLSVDGKELSRQKIEHSIPFLMAIDETFDIGSDTRTAVDDSYKLPFRFTGKIDKLTFKLGPEQLTAEEREVMKRALARARD